MILAAREALFDAVDAVIAENAKQQAVIDALLSRLTVLEQYVERQKRYGLDADWNSSLQASLDEAKSKGISEVLLTPGQTDDAGNPVVGSVVYDISDQLTIWRELTLRGKGVNLTSGAPKMPHLLPHIRAATTMPLMARFETYASALHLWIDGNNKADVGTLTYNGIRNTFGNLFFNRILDTGMRFGGCLYTELFNLAVAGGKFGIDALNKWNSENPLSHYYGINGGSGRNLDMKGGISALRIEGKFSLYDPFIENGGVTGPDALIQVGSGPIDLSLPPEQKQYYGILTLYSPYYECARKAGNVSPLTANKVWNGSRYRAFGVEAYSKVTDPDAAFLSAIVPREVIILGGSINYFGKPYARSSSTYNSLWHIVASHNHTTTDPKHLEKDISNYMLSQSFFIQNVGVLTGVG